MYELFEHTADLGLRVRATTREELFTDAARGLFSVIVANPQDVRPTHEAKLTVEDSDPEFLFFDWLSELLFVYETQRMLLANFDVQFTSTGLEATVRGEPVDAGRHRLEHEVKAITYHGLKVIRNDDGWLAEVIVDI